MTEARKFPKYSMIDLTLAGAAVALVAWVILRDTVAPSRAVAETEPSKVTEETWRHAREIGIEIGDQRGTLQIVEFLDLECPGCAQYDRTVLQPLLTRSDPPRVSLVVVHFPLGSHQFARSAGAAAECAGHQNAFGAFVKVALEKQHEIKNQTWSSLAAQAGVSDTVRFRACLDAGTSYAAVDSGRALGDRLSIHATPTILVNGWRFPTPPTLARILEFGATKPIPE
jgi:protein-disulfide isomerase